MQVQAQVQAGSVTQAVSSAGAQTALIGGDNSLIQGSGTSHGGGQIAGPQMQNVAQSNVNFGGAPAAAEGGYMGGALQGLAGGGTVWMSEGGAEQDNPYYLDNSPGDGTSDSQNAKLARGEFVIPADVVSGLGNGSSDAGAEELYGLIERVRDHKHSNADKSELPPDSKGALAYLSA